MTIESVVPIISMFFGIVIKMFYREHRPPHVHVEHHGQKAVFDFKGNVIAGEINSPTATKLVKEWIALRRDDLENNWHKMEEGNSLDQIAPLE